MRCDAHTEKKKKNKNKMISEEQVATSSLQSIGSDKLKQFILANAGHKKESERERER